MLITDFIVLLLSQKVESIGYSNKDAAKVFAAVIYFRSPVGRGWRFGVTPAWALLSIPYVCELSTMP